MRWLIGSGPLGVREPKGQPTRPVADFVAATAAALVLQGDEVTLLFSERAPNGHEVGWLADRGIGWAFWGSGRPTTARHALVLHSLLKKLRPDGVMFEFGGVPLGLSLSFAHRVRVRIARYLTAFEAIRHDRQPIRRYRVLRRRYIYRCATHVAVNARPLAAELSSIYCVGQDRILLQLQGVHRPPLGLPALSARSRDLVCIGRIAPTKGQHVLVEALALLKRSGLEPRIHFVGGGDITVVQQRARAFGVLDQCVFHGEQSRGFVYDVLTRHAVAVQPSLADALPQSAQEAVVCGAVVVASRVGGIPDIVNDRESGLLVPPGDAVALTEALHDVLADEHLLATLAKGASTMADRIAMDVRAPAEAARLRQLLAGSASKSTEASVLEIPH